MARDQVWTNNFKHQCHLADVILSAKYEIFCETVLNSALVLTEWDTMGALEKILFKLNV